MLSKKMLTQLNEQIALEMYSSNLYLAMSSWCAHKGYEGCAAFLYAHAQEELAHMHKLFNYVNETGAMAIVPASNQPPSEFNALKPLFETVFNHELSITKAINVLADTALGEKDYSTFNFLQWYVAEQHEEERLFKSVLDKLEIIGVDGRGLYHFDNEMGKLSSK